MHSMAMGRVQALFLTFTVALWASAAHGRRHGSAPVEPPTAAPAPAPGADCSSVIYDMLPCVDYISVGSKQKKPPADCCSGLNVTLQTDPNCLCVALEESGSMGIDVDMNRAQALPAACGFPSPPKCDIPLPPGASPSPAPSPANPPEAPEVPPVSSPTPVEAPEAGGPAADQSPQPPASDAATFSSLIPAVALAVGLLVTVLC